jgi:tetratricopeptide (TPR) repeat protein
VPRPLLVAVVLGVVTLGLIPGARAQDASVAPPEAAQARGAEEEARTSFEEARAAFDEGRNDDALRGFRRAYELSRRSLLLYNIGASAERLARDEEALEAYRAFVEAEPEHPSRPEAERRIVVLEARIRARPTVAPEPDASAEPDAPPAQTTSGGWLFSWMALGATALAGGAAGLSWALANDAYAALEGSCYARGCSDDEIAASDVQARIDATTAMLVVTGVLGAATIALFVIEAPRTSSAGETSAGLELGVELRAGGAALRGTF